MYFLCGFQGLLVGLEGRTSRDAWLDIYQAARKVLRSDVNEGVFKETI
jgi:hypothetical protein